MISLLPIGKCEKEILFFLAEKLKLFGMTVKLRNELAVPKGSYSKKRQQFLAGKFLETAEKCQSYRVLGITEKDLYVKKLNFVFGLAQKGGKAAVISVSRLRFGIDPQKNKDNIIFQKRCLKEAVHELGHTMGLSHCSRMDCVMFFSNNLLDTDAKSERFCSRCRLIIEKSGYCTLDERLNSGFSSIGE